MSERCVGVGSRNVEQAEAMASIEQSQRRLEVALASPTVVLSVQQSHELRAAVGRAQTEVSALRREFDAPRRKLFTPPMPQLWDQRVEEVAAEQSRLSEEVDTASALPRRFGLLAAQLRGRIVRISSRLDTLSETWEVSAVREQTTLLNARYHSVCSNMTSDVTGSLQQLEELAGEVEQWEKVVDAAPEFNLAQAGDQLEKMGPGLPSSTLGELRDLCDSRDLTLVAKWPAAEAAADAYFQTQAQQAGEKDMLLLELNAAVDICVAKQASGQNGTAALQALEALDEAVAAVSLHGVTEESRAQAQKALQEASRA